MNAGMGSDGSSLTTQEALSLGYVTASKLVPKAELSSVRTAAVTKRRSFQTNCCWMNAPTVLFCVSSSAPTLRMAADEMEVSPTAGKVEPLMERKRVWRR